MMGLCCLTQSQARDDGWTSCLRGAGSAGGASWARRRPLALRLIDLLGRTVVALTVTSLGKASLRFGNCQPSGRDECGNGQEPPLTPGGRRADDANTNAKRKAEDEEQEPAHSCPTCDCTGADSRGAHSLACGSRSVEPSGVARPGLQGRLPQV